MKPDLSQTIEQYFSNFKQSATIYVGFSGGVDSTVLLHIIKDLPHNIVAIHINHGVNKLSDQWQLFCTQICQQYQIPLKTHLLSLKNKKNFEAVARKMRYQIFANYLTKNDVLCTAQHRDDQVETVLLRLLRGSGPVGLSAMPLIRSLGDGMLVRPWLSFSKLDILTYAKQHKLKWIEDDSNTDITFDRNFLRHKIIPLLETRWQNLSKTISRSADLCRLSIEPSPYSETFLINKLDNLSLSDASSAIYHWIRGISNIVPSLVNIQKIVNEVAFAKPDAKPQIQWSGGQIRRYQTKLYYLETPINPTIILNEYTLKKEIYLKECNLTLINQTDKILKIKFPQGGETIKFFGYHKKLKKLFQEKAIAPWLRYNIPLIFSDGQLVQVFNICFKDEFVKCKQ